MRGPHAELALPETRWPARVHAGLAVLTGDLALQAGPAQALEAVRLFGLYSRWELAPEAQGTAPDGALAPHWAPVLVTPDELGPAWTNGRLDLALQLQWLSDQGLPLGPPQGAQGSTQRWHYGQLLAWACRLRRLRAGAGLGCDWLSAELPAAAVMPAASAPAPARSSRRGAAATPEPQASGPAHAARLDVLGPHGVSIFGQLAPTWWQASAPTTSLPAPVDTGSGTSVAAAPSPPDSPANSPANEPTDSPSDSPFDSPATPARTARKTRAPRAVVTQAERTIDVA
jgi:fumarylacetoacetate (FAA) hydrolase